ncbi:MAG TPA: hypothetical protein VHC22_07755 [Pirellulales bacterium]|nr:hypothetical protein [Pirellulales bacterium]
MRRLLLGAALAIGAVGLAALAWHLHRASLDSQLARFHVGRAATFEQAKREIAAIETRSDGDDSIRELTSGWRTGNPSFDRYLAMYVSDPASSEALRRAFSQEFSWRPQLLHDWAHYWSWRAKQEPSDEIASIAGYLETLSAAAAPRQLTWREVLDVQAAFTLTGHADLARRLATDQWADRYQTWKKDGPDFSGVGRPKNPLPERSDL